MEENGPNTAAESEARRMMLLNDYANKLAAADIARKVTELMDQKRGTDQAATICMTVNMIKYSLDRVCDHACKEINDAETFTGMLDAFQKYARPIMRIADILEEAGAV